MTRQVCKLTIAGKEVIAGKYGEHSWPRPLGVNAPEVVWCLPAKVAEEVLKHTEVEITIQRPGQPTPDVYKRVVVVKEEKSDHPSKRYVKLSDTRWYLTKKHVKALYNIRIATGATQVLDIDGTQVQDGAFSVNDVILFADSSLKSGTPWTADQILEDVKVRILTPYNISLKKLARSLGGFTPPDVSLDGPGNIALAHAMSHVGGLDIRVDNDGNFELVDAMMGAERDMITSQIPYSLLSSRTGGVMRWVDMSHVAPVLMQQGFDAELEVRADGWLRAPGVSVSDPGKWPTLDNVIPVTDKTLWVTENGKSVQAQNGMLVEVDAWAAGIAADTAIPAPAPIPPQVTWSRSFMCEDYFAQQMEHWYVTGETGGLEATPAWINRYRAFKEHFLKTWRLNHKFSRLCLPGSIKAVRSQLLDPATQLRSPSSWFQDWVRKPSTRGVRDDKNFGWNCHNIPGTPSAQVVGPTKAYSDGAFPVDVVQLGQCKQAPVIVTCRDPVVGVFSLGFRKDIHDHTAELAPALASQLPSNDLNTVNRDAAIPYWELTQLVKTHRVITVFTAVPAAAPLYFVDVTPQEALARLGNRATMNPKGPAMQARTGPALQTARFAYSDGLRTQIQGIFDPTSADAARVLLQNLIPVNLAILKDYAVSVAAALYATMLDHFEGDQTIDYRPKAMPIGSLQNVTHTVSEQGHVYTTFNARFAIPAVQPIHFMERGARNVILRNPSSYQ